MTVTRGTTNRNDRGSAKARRARKKRLLARDGDGTTAPCHTCGTPLTFATATVDRAGKPGVKGGRYVDANCKLQCALCASRQGAAMAAESRRWNGFLKRGLKRTRTAPEGHFAEASRWWIHLDGGPVGYVQRTASGHWTAWRLTHYGNTDPVDRLHDGMKVAIVALANRATAAKTERVAA